MEICWQDANFGLREEIVSRLYYSFPAPRCKRSTSEQISFALSQLNIVRPQSPKFEGTCGKNG